MPLIVTRGAISARGYGFSASSPGVSGTPFPNSNYQYAFGGYWPCSVTNAVNRFYVNGTLRYSESIGSSTNGCGSVGASSNNIMSFGFYYGNTSYSPHMYDNELGTRKDASAYYGRWYSTPYVAICSKSIVMYCQGGIFGGTLWRSTDGGSTYTSSTPFTGNLHAMHARGTYVFVSTYSGGVLYNYVSTDSGATWTTSGITGLPTTYTSSNPQSFSVYSNGKHNYWVQSGSGYQYYTSTNGTNWTFIGGVSSTNPGFSAANCVWYHNGYYYGSSADYSFSSFAGYRSADGYTWSTFGFKPSFPGFGYGRITATSSGLVMSYTGNCCSGTRYNPTIYTTNSFDPPSAGSWSVAYSYNYLTYGRLSAGVRGYNQDQG